MSEGRKVWIDILTPKQVLFTEELKKRLEENNYSVFLTSRDYREVNELLQLKEINTTVVGRYGGRSLIGKLRSSSARIERLIEIIAKEKPHVALSFASPEAARVSFGLGIPHLCICDSPHAESVCRLTIPLSKKLIAPKLIPIAKWRPYGVLRKDIVQYDALDPVVWLRKFKPNSSVLKELGIDLGKPIITVRLEESFAAYLLKEGKKSITLSIIRKLMKRFDQEIQLVAIPRYADQIKQLRKIKGIIIPPRAIDGPSLLSYSSIFIGGGGTMTIESLLLGTPTLSCYPGKLPYIHQYLIKEGVLYHTTQAHIIIRKVDQWLKQLNNIRQDRKKWAEVMMSKMEDPIDVILKVINEVCT